jgi:predicted DsbA family dithiol-disulfide isomerase
MDRRINGVKKLALGMLEDAIEFIQEKAKTNNESALKEVLEATYLDLYIQENKAFELRVKIAKARMKGVDITSVPSFVMDSLYDCTFEAEDYKAIGENDGILIALNQIFKKLGMHSKAREACAWTYKFD